MITSAVTQLTDVTRHPLDGSIVEYAWLLPVLPLVGAIVNGLVALLTPRAADHVVAGAHEAPPARAGQRRLVSMVAVGVLLGAFALAVAMFATMRGAGPIPAPWIRNYGQWIPAGSLAVAWGVQVDQLSILMTLVVTGVGTLIHIYSIGYMKADAGFARYFAYLNLFVASMLTLVLAANYPVMFVGWEGVGLCSYLLIGFWFDTTANVEAGKKAFVVNRIGDLGLMVAMFLMWTQVQHLDFAGAHAALATMSGSAVVQGIALALFLGCVGKSAQIPLYVWLPDAMAGPTPVSALIHAATMVTAGVYLVVRAGPIFAGAPSVSLLVAVIGGLTALFAATVAMRQWDIKRVLAYSTVSQLGYMFMAVGSGAYTAGIFHLVTHAFFKALLFLGAGSVIHALHTAYASTDRHDDPQDMRNMGGLSRLMPATAVSMGLGTLAIAGIPPLAGFFSKDEILSSVFARAHTSPLATATLFGVSGHTVLYAVFGLGALTALLTAVYMTRLMMLTFAGQNRTGESERPALHEAPMVMTAPVIALGVLTVIGGWLNLPRLVRLGPPGVLARWLDPVTGVNERRLAGGVELAHATEELLLGLAIVIAVAGIGYAVWRYRGAVVDKAQAIAAVGVARLLENAYGVDALLDRTLVRPLDVFASRVMTGFVDRGVDRLVSSGGTMLRSTAAFLGSRLQDGDVGKYAWMIAAGGIVVLTALSLH